MAVSMDFQGAIVTTETSSTKSDPFSRYESLAAEYRASVLKCQAILDQLQAAERELKAVSTNSHFNVDANASAELGAAVRRFSDRNNALDVESIKALSHRERNVFELIGQGLSTCTIANRLSIAVSTVETYRERLKTKLSLSTGNELTRFAILWFDKR
jgi:DNA-binding NarL/FixJ family response regulator